MKTLDPTAEDRRHPDPEDLAPLEDLLGDPNDQDNPVGFAALLRADDRGTPLPAAERLLETHGLGAELVPVELGGRLDRADRLAVLLRPLFRRDAGLAVAHGAGSPAGALAVWSAGSPEQRARAAAVLLNGGRIAAPGPADATVLAAPDGTEVVLNGRQAMVSNLARAELAVLPVRHGDRAATLLLDLDAVPRDGLRFLPRHRTVGLRTAYLDGVDFRDGRVPAGALLAGPAGAGPAARVAAAVLAGATVGTLDQQLRTVTGFATGRRLYQRTVSDLPHARAALTGAYLDLLTIDALAGAVCRSLHLLPDRSGGYTAAARTLLPRLTQEAAGALTVLLGARSFLREGPHGIFQKHLRDLSALRLLHGGDGDNGGGHGGGAGPVVPPPPDLGVDPVAGLFDPDGVLPGLDYGRLAGIGIGTGTGDRARRSDRADPLLAVLPAAAAALRTEPVLGPLCAQLADELRDLVRDLAEAPPGGDTPAAAALAERHAILLAAAACLGTWQHHTSTTSTTRAASGAGTGTSFLGEPDWLTGALARLTARLGCSPVPGAEAGHARVFAELTHRQETGRAFDLTGRRLA
ncbi:acyl-CoA dehydrogenase [Kitasatospora sp. NPDC088346]|uniref:acyl-CoA dehydrogenase n=1 Tax=Kitasatospora sp. NPDC088346 TaxID=3364073 RepID=UPI003801E56C